MRLTILGSGTMVPVKGRYPSSYLIEHDDVKLLVDCGHMTIARLLEQNISLQDITAIAISHFHTDHFSHLLPLVHSRFVEDLYTKQPHRPLTIIGPHTLIERFRTLREVTWPEPKEEYPLTFHECSGAQNALSAGAITITPFPVSHVPWFPSVGYRIEAGGASIAYTGDLGSTQSPEFEAGIRDADLLLIEAAALEPRPNHFTPHQALELGVRCGVKRVLLTHLRIDRTDDAKAFAAHHANILMVAEDGMRIDL